MFPLRVILGHAKRVGLQGSSYAIKGRLDTQTQMAQIVPIEATRFLDNLCKILGHDIDEIRSQGAVFEFCRRCEVEDVRGDFDE